MLELKMYLPNEGVDYEFPQETYGDEYPPVDKWIDRIVYYYRMCEESGYCKRLINHDYYEYNLKRIVKGVSLSTLILAQTHIDEGMKGDPWFKGVKNNG